MSLIAHGDKVVYLRLSKNIQSKVNVYVATEERYPGIQLRGAPSGEQLKI